MTCQLCEDKNNPSMIHIALSNIGRDTCIKCGSILQLEKISKQLSHDNGDLPVEIILDTTQKKYEIVFPNDNRTPNDSQVKKININLTLTEEEWIMVRDSLRYVAVLPGNINREKLHTVMNHITVTLENPNNESDNAEDFCDMFEKGEPTDFSDCTGTGHYLCYHCKQYHTEG